VRKEIAINGLERINLLEEVSWRLKSRECG
jgi:hypothetical protein